MVPDQLEIRVLQESWVLRALLDYLEILEHKVQQGS